jgi:hypothetical protein
MTLEDFSPDKLAILEAKLRADLETVQKMRALMLEHVGKLTPTPAAAPAPVEPPPVKNLEPRSDFPPGWRPHYVPPPTVKMEVRAVVAEIKGPFKFGVVKARLAAKHSGFGDTSVRSVLMRMVQAGELKIVQQGYGRGGSTFQKTGEEEVIPPEPAVTDGAE